MIRIDLGTEDLGGGGKGSKNPLKKLLDRLRMRKAGARQVADPFAGSSTSFFSRLAGAGSVVLILLAMVGAVVPHFAFVQYRDLLIKKNEETKKELEDQLAALTREISRLVPFQKELETYDAQKKLLRERLDLIQSLLASRGTPVNVLDTVGQSLPTKAWLTTVDFDAKQSRPVILLNGQTLGNDEVADYIDKLSESAYLNDVVLDNMTNAKGTGTLTNTDVRQFQISLFPKGLASMIKKPEPTPVPTPTPAPAEAAPETGVAKKPGGRNRRGNR